MNHLKIQLPNSRLAKQRANRMISAWTLTGLFAVISVLTTTASTGRTQNKTVLAQATAAARVQQRQQQVQQVRPENYNLSLYPVIDKHEKHWRHLLWTTALVEPQEVYVAEAVSGILALTTRSRLSAAQRRTVNMAMQVGTQLYASQPNFYGSVGQQFLQTIERSPNPNWVAMALSGLVKAAGSDPRTLQQIQLLSDRVKVRFPNWSRNVALQTTLRDTATLLKPARVPPLKDLLNWTIAPNQLHLYVVCQPDRTVLCQAVLKDRKGQFVRQQGKLWSVPLLLRSIHYLSWNFERGQTPQGIYRIEGVVPQPDTEFFRAFGQFALVNLFVPFEPGAREFIPGKKGAFRGSLAAYRALLPPTWRKHWPIEQAFWAGKLGRSLFRIHGSGEGLDFFSGKQRNPDSYSWNPTIGCLSALETYDESGKLQQADMPKILNALVATGGKNFSGYLIVVEVPGRAQKPIAITEIEAVLRQGNS